MPSSGMINAVGPTDWLSLSAIVFAAVIFSFVVRIAHEIRRLRVNLPAVEQ